MNENNESSSASSTCNGSHASINSPAKILSNDAIIVPSDLLLLSTLSLDGKYHNSFHNTTKSTNKVTEKWIRKKEKYVADLAILHNSPKCRTNCVILHNVSQLSEGLAQWLNGTTETAKNSLNGNSENSIHIFATDQTCSAEIIWVILFKNKCKPLTDQPIKYLIVK
ncbi:unnamed protein product [Brugia timori]|uniref:Uncharacterized protein n=1 Tax=Brugia timori TaxID=42155 RepID=A0A0R3QJN8_9BILA|nr:unnamed protein product [Brugia timori]